MNETITSKFKESKYEVLVMLLLSIYSFFGYLLPQNILYFVLVISLTAIIFSFMIKKNIFLSYKQLGPIFLITLFMLTQLLLTRYSLFPSSSIKIAINRGTILAIGVLFYVQGNWYKNGIKFLFYFSCTHVLFTLISYFMPTLYQGIVLSFLPSHINTEISWFMSKGLYSGITDQIARNAFYISVGISILYSKLILYNNKYNKLKYMLLGLLLLSLLLTGKRGHLVANLISMLFVASIYEKLKGKSFLLKIFKVASIITFTLLISIYAFPETAAPFIRFIERQGGDQTSGRIALYINAIELFKQKPILGWGVGVFNNLYGIGTHNMYLQLLCENGLVGFIFFFSLLLVNFTNTLKALKQNILRKENNFNIYVHFSLYIQVFYLLYGLTGNPLNDGFILIIYLIASSIPYTLKNLKEQSNHLDKQTL